MLVNLKCLHSMLVFVFCACYESVMLQSTDDGEWPDYHAVVQRYGCCLIWDFTCPDTLAVAT